MYRIELSRKAARFYQKVDTVIVKRLNLAFSKLSEDPFQQYNVKKLSGELKGSYRLRLGDMRIIYTVDDDNKMLIQLHATTFERCQYFKCFFFSMFAWSDPLPARR